MEEAIRKSIEGDQEYWQAVLEQELGLSRRLGELGDVNWLLSRLAGRMRSTFCADLPRDPEWIREAFWEPVSQVNYCRLALRFEKYAEQLLEEVDYES